MWSGRTEGVCGRYVSVQERADLVELYNATAVGEAPAPSYNVAPTAQVEAVVEHADQKTDQVDRQLRTLQWGLVPSWAKDPKIGNRLINARVETLADKPSWRGPFRRQRAVIPAAGYYEWAPREHDSKVRKQPYYLHPTDPPGVLSFAGLYELWRDPSKEKADPARWLWTAVIITTDATGPAGDIHDRTPLILPRDRVDAWLDPWRTEPDEIYEVLDGIVLESLAVRAVSHPGQSCGHQRPRPDRAAGRAPRRTVATDVDCPRRLNGVGVRRPKPAERCASGAPTDARTSPGCDSSPGAASPSSVRDRSGRRHRAMSTQPTSADCGNGLRRRVYVTTMPAGCAIARGQVTKHDVTELIAHVGEDAGKVGNDDGRAIPRATVERSRGDFRDLLAAERRHGLRAHPLWRVAGTQPSVPGRRLLRTPVGGAKSACLWSAVGRLAAYVTLSASPAVWWSPSRCSSRSVHPDVLA